MHRDTPVPQPQERKTCFLPRMNDGGLRRSNADEQITRNSMSAN